MRAKSVNLDFFKAWTPEMAWLLGFVFGDGCVGIYQYESSGHEAGYRTMHQFSLASADRGALELARDLMESDHAIGDRPGYFTLQISRREIVEDLMVLGMTPNNSRDLRFPDVPADLTAHFVRGFFDADGCIHLHEGCRLQVTFCSGDPSFLDALEGCIDLPSSRYVLSNGTYGGSAAYLRYAGRASHLLLDWLYADAGDVCLERKHAVYVGHCEVCPVTWLARWIGDEILHLGRKFNSRAFVDTVLLLQDSHPYRPAEIARMLGINRNTVKRYRDLADEWGLL